MNFEENSYFTSYGDVRVQSLMLTDRPRVEAYRTAIFDNIDVFKGKTVLDIGAGTGILSLFCAQAGAKRVYSIEASQDLIPIIEDIVKENKFEDVISVIKAQVEDIPDIGETPKDGQPILPELVDVIISEWMGFFLFHEGMLESVINARRFLKQDGIIYPDECTVFVALCELPEFFLTWDNFHGLSMTNFGKRLREASQTEPQILYVDETKLISKPVKVYSFNTKHITEQELEHISATCVASATREGNYQGLCLWFEVNFSTQHSVIKLSTSPFAPKTHWKQTVIVLPDSSPIGELEPVAFSLSFRKNAPRTYEISLNPEDAENVSHPIPCYCYNIKCRIICAYMDSTGETNSTV